METILMDVATSVRQGVLSTLLQKKTNAEAEKR